MSELSFSNATPTFQHAFKNKALNSMSTMGLIDAHVVSTGLNKACRENVADDQSIHPSVSNRLAAQLVSTKYYH